VNGVLRKLNAMENRLEFLPSFALHDNIYFNPQVLIATKLKNKSKDNGLKDEFYIYNGMFGLFEPNSKRQIVEEATPIEKRGAIGSDTNCTRMRMDDIKGIQIKRLNNGMHELTTNITIGIAIHVIGRALHYDCYTGYTSSPCIWIDTRA
jgi:hypothetical protein